MSALPKLTETEVKRGYWLYAGVLRKTVMIFRLNYDFYYELEKEGFFDMSNGTPELNEEGHTYLIRWPAKKFIAYPGSFTVPSNSLFLTLEGAIDEAEQIVQQPIKWIN